MAFPGKLALLLLLCGSSAFAQRLVSARAGTVNFIRGTAFLDGRRVFLTPNKLLVMQNGQTLRTETGRVELLLVERVFLRMGEASAIRMDENQMPDTRLALERGSAVIEVLQIAKGAHLRIVCGDRMTELKNPGVYRFDAKSEMLRVYNGEVALNAPGAVLKAKAGQAVNLTGDLVASRFDPKETDSLKAWADQRMQQRIARQRRQQEARAMLRVRRDAQIENQQQGAALVGVGGR